MRLYCGRRTPKGQLLNTDEELALYLIESANVVTVPGEQISASPGIFGLLMRLVSKQSTPGIERLAEALYQLSV